MKIKLKMIASTLTCITLASSMFALPAQARWDEMVINNKPYSVTPLDYQSHRAVTESAQTGMSVYRVKAGDTLWELARKYSTTVEKLAAINGLNRNSILHIGQDLDLPVASGSKSGAKYTIKHGDNLYNICRQYQVTVSQLLKENNIKNPNYVKVGQTLTIPSGQQTVQLAAATTGEGLPVMAMNWPISGRISDGFGIRKEGRPHHGIDIAAPHGAAVKAPHSGVVIYSGYYGTYGNTIIIDHGEDTHSLYAHCTTLFARTGQKVYPGTVIATVGNTGRSFGPHLHWEVQYKGVPFDPTLCTDAEKLYLATKI
ncbi:MAG: M23 family metallopeptidase [Firmicutes bacterium]|nr:M23 family metallopeptidase [Bacillota bacterium]